MSKARLIITAVVLEGRPQAVVAREYDVSPSWVSKLVARYLSRLHHIGIGKRHTGTYVVLLIDDLHIRIIHAATGEVLRDLILDPTKDYQPTGKPPGPPSKNQTSGPT